MKNIMIIDNSQDYLFDIHAVSDDDFLKIFFRLGQNVEFNDDLYRRPDIDTLNEVFHRMWYSRIENKNTFGIHGILFYDDWDRKQFYIRGEDIEQDVSFNKRSNIENMMTVVVMDERPNFPILTCLIDGSLFETVFPQEHQDVEFSEDLEERLGPDKTRRVLKSLIEGAVPKSSISSINGIIYIGHTPKKMYYVTKIDREIPRHYPLNNSLI